MSDKLFNNQEENYNINMDENRGALIFGNEEKLKPINETSSFKGKSCFKKEKEKDRSKFAVKIMAPDPSPKKSVEPSNEEVKERRKRRHQFQTVKEPAELKNKDILNLKKVNRLEEKDEIKEEKKFVRKGKRSTTLIEKSKLGQKLIAAEMNVQVKQETLIIQEKGNPSKKYKPTKILGSGSFGSVYVAINNIFQNTVAMKVIKKDPNNELDEQEIKNEIDILKKLSHPNIVKIYEFYISNSHYYIINDFFKDGELFSYIKNKYSER